MRILIKLLSAVMILGVGYFAYGHFAKPPAGAGSMMRGGPPGGVPVEVASVRDGVSRASFSAVGTLKANESVMLRPEIAGQIEAIHFTEGSIVTKGMPLISIDARIANAELKQFEAALKLANVTYNRAKLLKEKGAGTISSFDNADAARAVAQAQVDLARTRLDKTNIAAPFDGTVGLRKVSPGDYVAMGQELVSFQSITPMKVDFALPENAARFIKADQKVELRLDAFPAEVFIATVYAIAPQINEQSRTLEVRALLENPDAKLKAGFFANVSLLVGDNASALFVPEAAILPSGNDNFVYVVGEDNKVAMRKVHISNRKNGEVEIADGLKANELVVTAGHLKIRDGAGVSVVAPSGAPASGEKAGAKP